MAHIYFHLGSKVSATCVKATLSCWIRDRNVFEPCFRQPQYFCAHAQFLPRLVSVSLCLIYISMSYLCLSRYVCSITQERKREFLYYELFFWRKKKKELRLGSLYGESLIKACMANWQYDIHTFTLLRSFFFLFSLTLLICQ